MSELYNAPSRHITAQLEFYFTSTPVLVDKHNYLISFDILEELGNDSESNPVGDVSANELDIKLFNSNGMFSPSNTSSPYYGYMKEGVKVVVKVRASEESAWDELGTFYVKDWYAEVTGLQATVTCYDKIYSVTKAQVPALPITNDTTYVDAFRAFLNGVGVSHNIDTNLPGRMSWWYVMSKSQDTLKKLAGACSAAVFCDRHDNVKVLNASAVKGVQHILTDADQIISASIKQSINKEYNGLDISISNAQLSDTTSLLDIKEYSVVPGIVKSIPVEFSSRPVARLECAKLDTASQRVDLLGFAYNTDTFEMSIRNDEADHSVVAVSAYGRVVESVKAVYAAYGDNPLVFSNEYVQNEAAAARIASILDRYINSQLPDLDLVIRGNPSYQLGDKLTVSSVKYNLLFTGILQRAHYFYDGALHCDIRLVNSEVLEVS